MTKPARSNKPHQHLAKSRGKRASSSVTARTRALKTPRMIASRKLLNRNVVRARIGIRVASQKLSSFVRDLIGRDIRKGFDDFGTRLMFQKLVYLSQEGGVLKSPRHSYNLYVYGPYSPEWAAIGFDVASGKDPLVEVAGNSQKVRRLIAKDLDPSWMAAVATLHWYVVKMKLGKAKARAKAEAQGKLTLTRRFDEVWEALETAKWLS